MNIEAQEYLKTILAKEPEALSFDEREFLRARRSYLKKSQLEEYQSILETTETVDPAIPVEDEVEPVGYDDLLKLAKDLGYVGKRLKRSELEEFITTNQTQKNPFN